MQGSSEKDICIVPLSFVKYTFQIIAGISEHVCITEENVYVYFVHSVTRDSCSWGRKFLELEGNVKICQIFIV